MVGLVHLTRPNATKILVGADGHGREAQTNVAPPSFFSLERWFVQTFYRKLSVTPQSRGFIKSRRKTTKTIRIMFWHCNVHFAHCAMYLTQLEWSSRNLIQIFTIHPGVASHYPHANNTQFVQNMKRWNVVISLPIIGHCADRTVAVVMFQWAQCLAIREWMNEWKNKWNG